MRKLPGLLLCILLFLAFVPAYQLLYSYSITNGDPSGLFLTGGILPRVPELQDHTYYYENSYGYDGQMYRILAYDPLLRRNFTKYVDDPRYRGRRILIPALAGTFGDIFSRLLGSPPVRTTDICYVVILDFLLAWGCWYFVRLTEAFCPPWLAVTLYCLLPGVVASADRMLVDGSGVAGLAAALVLYREKKHGTLMVVLTLLALTRETNVMLTAGIFLTYVGTRQYRRAVASAATLIPLALWSVYLTTRTAPSGALNALSLPILPHIRRLLTPLVRPIPAWENTLTQTIDILALLCLFVAFALFAHVAWRALRSRDWSDEVWIVLPAVLLAAISSYPGILVEPYAFMRVDSVLLTWATWRLLMRGRAVGATYLLVGTLGIIMFRVSPVFTFFSHVAR